MECKVTIAYEWWEEEGTYEVREEHREELEKIGLREIEDMLVEGYTSGKLHNSLRTADGDGGYAVKYVGRWSMTSKVED